MKNEFQKIVGKIREAAIVASKTPNRPEAKLRELVTPLWNQYMQSKDIDLNFYVRNERSLAYGKADAVYNRVIIEYKKPGVIKANNARNRLLIAQVKGYIEDLANEEGWKKERLLGVAFDGHYFLFIRKVRRWIEEEPVPLSVESVERFLLTLEKLTSKSALIPENLIRDFAVGGDFFNSVAANAIKAFYFALNGNVNEKVRVFFEQWSLQFSEVHGSIEKKDFDSQTLFNSYGFIEKEQKNFDFNAFFFALDTYYGLLMKLLAYQVVGFYTLKDIAGLPLSEWEKLDSDTLKDKMAKLEEGGIFRNDPFNIRNFLEGDLLSWYLNNWNDSIEKAIREIIKRLNLYDPKTMELLPDETRDILKRLYQFLVPKQIRHDLGEYYTPDWLAERCLNQVGYGVKEPDLLKKRILDPGCGSGTFLVLAIKRAKENARLYHVPSSQTLSSITRNIVGFDLNPLAVISARTNYLLAIADLLKYKKGEITIPVYLCDSINPPKAKEKKDLLDTEAGDYTVATSVGAFRFPGLLIKKDLIQKITASLEDGIKNKLSREKFLIRAHAELEIDPKDKNKFDELTGETYQKLRGLEEKGINGIWSRIIKNAFAPLFVGKFDFVVGNPPWVNWESLPEDYRKALLPINHNIYKLFLHSGLAARHGAAKIDLCSLMFYVSIDKYLRTESKMCFVVTQTLFKSAGGSKGFRQFYIHPSKTPIRVEQVDDFVELQPFDSAANRTALLSVVKGQETTYPVSYLYWSKTDKGSVGMDLSFDEVMAITERHQLYGRPINSSDPLSSWICARKTALMSVSKITGKSAYKAHEGANTGGANGVYWVEMIENYKNVATVSNLHDSGKRKVEPVKTEIETDFLFPLLRGRDVSRWKAQPKYYIIVPQDFDDPKTAFDEKKMEKHFPNTYDYFMRFKGILGERKSQVIRDLADSQAFYFIYSIKAYTFAPYKVVWKEQSSDFECAVISTTGGKIVVPDHKLMLVDVRSAVEANYICALLNSLPSRFIVRGYTVSIQQSTHILDNIRIPKYDETVETHKDLAKLSKLCHEKVAVGIDVSDLEEQIDKLAAEIWGLTKEELKEIKDSLEEMR